MEQLLSEIRFSYLDKRIDDVLMQSTSSQSISSSAAFSFHFTQNEELFLKLPASYSVPSFRIHHDIRDMNPGEEYIGKLRTVLQQITRLCPLIFQDLSYYFDPSEIFRPCFFRIDRAGGRDYLYLLRLDFSFKPAVHRPVSETDNDHSPEYVTNLLYLESDYIPLERIEQGNSMASSCVIRQVVSNTWIGERGKGYTLQGIWMDRDLTKYLSRLLIAPDKRLYPYYPFTCKYKTVSLSLVHLSPKGRKRFLPLLHNVLILTTPHMRSIENDLRESEFSESLPSFQSLKKSVPSEWTAVWSSYQLTPSINEQGRKEWKLDFPYS